VIEEIRLKLQSVEHASMGKQPQSQGPPQQSQATLPFSATKETEARNSMLSVLEEWLRLTGDPILNSEKARTNYITQIQHQGIISSDEISALFFRTGVEKRFEFILTSLLLFYYYYCYFFLLMFLFFFPLFQLDRLHEQPPAAIQDRGCVFQLGGHACEDNPRARHVWRS